jgi:chromosome partitioning protein
MRRIAIINQKGGVGKTTTTANLGAALALQGRRVLVIDMDAQANLTLALGIEPDPSKPSSYSVLAGTATVGQAIVPTAIPNLRLLPANIDLSGAELELASAMGREFVLRDALTEWNDSERTRTGRDGADYVLFDCPPSLGLLAINSLSSAGEVLITLQTEFLALQGMSKLVEVVQLLKKRLNPELTITGILPCMYDSRKRLAREVLHEIRSYFKGQVLPVSIRSNVKLAEAPSYGKTIFSYAADSSGAQDYMAVAQQLIEREGQWPALAGLPKFDPQAKAPLDAEAQAKKEARKAVRPPPPRKKVPSQVAPQPVPPASTAATRPSNTLDIPPLPPDAFEILSVLPDAS